MGGDAALLQWGSVRFYGTLLLPHTPSIGESLSSSVARGRTLYSACPTSASTASRSRVFHTGSPMVSLVSPR